ncbi:cyclase family protein [Streptomyces kaempferi]
MAHAGRSAAGTVRGSGRGGRRPGSGGAGADHPGSSRAALGLLGRRPAGILLLATGWSAHWGTDHYAAHPWLTPEAARSLVTAGVRTVAVDALSVDPTGGAELRPPGAVRRGRGHRREPDRPRPPRRGAGRGPVGRGLPVSPAPGGSGRRADPGHGPRR